MMSRKSSALAVSTLLAAGMVGYYLQIFLPRVRSTRAVRNITFFYGEDLYPYWSGTREVFTRRVSPYSEESTRQIQIAVYGRALDPDNPFERDQHRFSYPLYVVFLMAPIVWLPFPVLRGCVAVVLPLFTLLGMVLWQRGLGLKVPWVQCVIVGILTLSSYPLLNGLFAQQLSLMVYVALAGCIWCLSQEKLTTAGILLAVSTIKPQLALLIILMLFLWSASKWRERKNLVVAFLATLGLLCAASFWLLPTWPPEWLKTITAYRQYTVPPLTFYILGKMPGAVLTCVLLGFSAWLAWKTRRDETTTERFSLAVAFTLATAVVTIPAGDAVYDHVLLVPGVLLLLTQGWRSTLGSGILRVLAVITAATFGWQWVSGTAVVVVDLLRPGLLRSAYVLSAPLRTQPSMPFALLALLGLGSFYRFRPARAAAVQRSSSLVS